MKSIYSIFAIVFALTSLTACNTTAGIGKDIEHAGAAIEEAAEDTHDEVHD